MRLQSITGLFLILLSQWTTSTNAFVLPMATAPPRTTRLPFSSVSSSPGSAYSKQHRQHASRLFALPDMGTMKAGEMRTELESYGISTKSFLEKRDFVKALEEARAAGKEPKKQPETKTNGEQKQAKKEPANGNKKESSAGGAASRAERLQQEMAKAKGMKVGDLKKELEARGVSTKSFFEKTEFVKAYAEAIVDGKAGKAGGSSAGKAGTASPEEKYDSSYRDVSMRKMDTQDPRLLQGTVIDVKTKR
jgi:hypothetical protein